MRNANTSFGVLTIDAVAKFSSLHHKLAFLLISLIGFDVKELRERILSAQHDKDIEFDDLCTFAQQVGFQRRTGGKHGAIFYKKEIPFILNLQPRKDGSSKPYQVKQVRDIVLFYKL